MPSIVPSTVLNGDVVGSPVEGPSPTRCTKCTAQQRPYPPSVKRRNLVVCIDGTSNKFGQNNTNVVKLFSKIKFDSEAPLPRQLAYYSSGVGTGPKPWHVVSRIQRSLSDLLDEAVAWNVAEIVQDAYGWLAREYREGDQIYLFGFSRGAYQVRILAAVIYEVGLIKTVTDKQIGMAYEHYMTVRLQKLHAKDMASAFRRTFCWKDMKVHFVGVWDTVSSVGLVKEDASLSSSSSADHACHFRHALALDERRVKFLPEYFREINTVTDDKKAASAQKQKSKYIDEKGASDKQASQLKGAFGNSTASKASNIKEVWFAGSHSDVGGRNEPGRSSHAGNVSLMWMRQEASECGLVLKPTDTVWTPSDLDYGTSDSMSLTWNLFEFFPIKHQISWSGAGEHVRKWHLSKPRRIIPGQKIHASILFANTYRPRAHLGEGFVFPAGWPSTTGDELDGKKWEKVLFDFAAVRELFGRLRSSQRAPLRYLDRLLFVLRFRDGRKCVRGEDRWQETFEKIIHGNSDGIVKLVAIVAYYEASIDDATPSNDVVNEVTVSKDAVKEAIPSKDTEATSTKHVVNQVTLLEDVLKNARTCLQDILSRRTDRNCRRVIALLRPLTDHEALRKEILTAEVIKTFMGLLDDVLLYPGPDFGQTMDAFACLLQHEDLKIPLFEDSRPSLMLAGQDESRLTASLHVILPFARTERGRTDCKDLKPRLCHLAKNHQGRVGLLAVEVFLELYEIEEGNTEAEQLALIDQLRNRNFRANLAYVFNFLSGTDNRTLSRNPDDHASSHVLRRLFGPGDGGQALQLTQKKLIQYLQSATGVRDAPERTSATLTLLKLCEDSKLRTHLLGEDITGAFIKQLRRRDSSLLGAHALTTCLQYEDMKQPILSNDKVLKYLVKMLRLDSFDDAVGQIEGWRIFAHLMRELIQDDDLKRKMEGEDSEITKVLEEKLIRGKPKDIRTSLLCLEILRSLGEHPHEGDFWTKSLVGKSLAHLESGKWKTQKAGITILSTLAQTKYGVDAIMPHIESIINMLLPDSLEPQEKTAGGSPLEPSHMLGPACALHVLSEDETLRKTTRDTEQLESLKDLWLDGNLIEGDTPQWRVKTPTKDDVLKMIDKMIKSVSGDFSEDLGTTSVGRSTLPEIQHWGRLADLVRASMVKVVAPPAKVTAKAVRYTTQRLSPRQMTYFLGRLQQRRSQHAG